MSTHPDEVFYRMEALDYWRTRRATEEAARKVAYDNGDHMEDVEVGNANDSGGAAFYTNDGI